MRLKSLDVGLLLLAGALASGCVGHGELTARDSVEETRPLEPGGTFRLQNTNGRVTVTTWDESQVRIEAERAAATERGLDEIEIDVRGEGDRVEVTTRLPKALLFGHAGSVEYHVTVPRLARLEIETVNGRLSIEGVTGSVNASTVNGSLEITDASGEVEASTVNGSIKTHIEKTDPTGRNSFSTVNGSVTLYLPADVSGTFDAHTVNGSIRTDFPLEVTGRWGKRLEGRLGDGRGHYEIETVNGSVRIRES
jgi:DUF4097 and DUF4098 domain-containing protein YvlB